MISEKYLEQMPAIVQQNYEFYSYGHAIEILTGAFEFEWLDLMHVLKDFYLTETDIIYSGGNKSPIPKRFDRLLFPRGWREIRITGDLTVHQYIRSGIRMGNAKASAESEYAGEDIMIKGYIDGHNIDFVKNRVAFDLEWNSKDQTFDRDLLAMRTYFECGVIDVGIIVTRANSLNEVFNRLSEGMLPGLKQKYGASTTHIAKLLPRLDSRRNGGCPILAIGITDKCVRDGRPEDYPHEFR